MNSAPRNDAVINPEGCVVNFVICGNAASDDGRSSMLCRTVQTSEMPGEGQLLLKPIAARSGLIAEPKLAPDARQFRRQSLHSRRCVRNLAILAHITPRARFGKRHVSLCTSRYPRPVSYV
jgi:hypothetical protein